jgi:signal transduction histidine kinase/ferredoxin
MKIRFHPDDLEVSATPENTVLQSAIEGNIPLSHLCGGQTRCTTCRVRVVEGLDHCGPRTDQEQRVADQSHFPDDIRLACQMKVEGDVTLRRLVVDDEDMAMTTQAVVERVRSEVLQMQRSSDLSTIVGILWEGLHDVGLHVDYCAVEIQREGESGTLAVAGNWLERRHGIEPHDWNVVGAANGYAGIVKGALIEDTQEAFRQTWSITSSEGYSSGSWWDVRFTHGRFVVMTRREDAFDQSAERTLATFGDSVALAYARAYDFQRLEDSNVELQETLSKLKRTQAELVQSAKMASLGQLVAGVAHEVNTPLGAIQSNNDTLTKSADRLRDGLPEDDKLRRVVNVIDNLTQVNRTAIERIDTVVTNLRRFSRLDEASIASYDVREGLTHTIALVGQEYTGRITIETNFGETPSIQCYPDLINQAFMNVIINACQSITGDGTVSVDVTTADTSVLIGISDTGDGIAEENLDKIFDPGYTTRGVGVGTGLGLSIVHQIIEKHSGSIAVTSEVGTGTTVTISLPVNP